MKTGVLLVNLGSPEAPTSAAVGPYLRQFLMDPHVITIPAPLRWVLVNCLIVPFRKHRSAEAYSKIWSKAGSPLVQHTLDLVRNVSEQLGKEFVVEPGMRYGNPSIEEGLTKLKYAAVDQIIAIPLYPQYAASSTETAIQEIRRSGFALGLANKIKFIDPFYNQPGYVAALAESCATAIQEFQPNHILFSYHGLPTKAVTDSCAISNSCINTWAGCGRVDTGNTSCYRAHCYATTQFVVERLGVKRGTYSIGFQSRLTKNWIQPFTDVLLEELAGSGIKKLLVACPSFVADCLETLEEIEIRAASDFRKFGGKELKLIPSLNTNPLWVTAVSQMIREKT